MRLRNHMAQLIQCFFRYNIFLLNILLKAFIQKLQITQLIRKKPPALCCICHVLELIRGDIILIKFRQHGLDLMDIARPLQLLLKQYKLLFHIRCHLTEHKVFPRIIQHHTFFLSHFVRDPVDQSGKAQYIDIHNAATRMHLTDLFLCVHRKLIRYHQKEMLCHILL